MWTVLPSATRHPLPLASARSPAPFSISSLVGIAPRFNSFQDMGTVRKPTKYGIEHGFSTFAKLTIIVNIIPNCHFAPALTFLANTQK